MDQISLGAYNEPGLIELKNGNYVVTSLKWKNPEYNAAAAGAVTWCDGTKPTAGPVSSQNSLVGTHSGDMVGSCGDSPSDEYYNGIYILKNGDYLVFSADWDNDTIKDAGAVTWCDGTKGTVGNVSETNSLIGSSADDQVGIVMRGEMAVTELTNGNYVIVSPTWDRDSIADAGAVTWCKRGQNL